MFKPCKILVIGDIIFDTYIYGKASRLSQEAPVPVVLVNKQETSLGGASNVCANLKSLGAEVYLCGAVGEDSTGDAVIDMLQRTGIHAEAVIRVESHPTIMKTRVVSDGQHVVRYDIEQTFAESSSQRLIKTLSGLETEFDAIVFSDYDKGTISDKVTAYVKSSYNCPVFADPKPAHKELYRSFHCLTPNVFELVSMTGIKDIVSAAKQLKHDLALDCLVVTLSEKGVMLLDHEDSCHSFEAHKLSAAQTKHSKSDVTGAGDTLMAAFVISICSGMNYISALKIANIAAAIVVNQLGTVTCSLEELNNELENLASKGE